MPKELLSEAKSLELIKTTALLEAISRAQEHVISSAEPKQLFDGLLSDILKLTQSEYGFIGEILYKPDGQSYLKTHAISNIAWDDESREFYEVNAPDGLEFVNLKSLLGDVITTGKYTISNDPANDPHSAGTLEGHPPLKSFLGVPVYFSDKMMGVIGVANCPEGYESSVVDYLQPLLKTYGQIIEVLRKNSLQRLNRTLSTMLEIDQAIVRSTNENELLHAVCKVLVNTGGYRMAWVGFAMHDEEKTVKPVAQEGDVDNYLGAIRITWADNECGRGPTGASIRTGEIFVARDIHNDPNYKPWREAAENHGYASSIALPLKREKEVLGSLNIYAKEANAFDYDEVKLVETLANDLAYGISALRRGEEHDRAESALHASEDRLKYLLSHSSTVVYSCQAAEPYSATHISENITQIAGYTQEEFLSSPTFWADHIHPDDASRVFSELPLLFEQEKHIHEYRWKLKDGSYRWFHDDSRLVRGLDGEPVEIVGSWFDITDRKQAQDALRDSQDRLALATHAGGVGIWDWDLEKDMLLWDDRMYHLYGVRREDLSSASEVWRSCVHKDDLSRVQAEVRASISEKNLFDTEFRIVRPDGETRYIKAFADVIADEHGNAIRMVGTNWDITERKKAKESMQMASSIYQSTTEAIMVTDENNIIIDINPAFTTITGYELAEVTGKNPRILQSGRHDEAFYQEMWQAILHKGHWQGEIWDRRKNGETYAKWVNISVIRHPDGQVHRYIAQFSDITEEKEKDELIWTQANYDMLTQLPNRRLLHDRLGQEIKSSHRNNLPFAMMFIDLDRFKEINDTMGHAKGDLMLMEAARRINECVRETDTIARLGGDEFTALLPDFGDRLHLERIAQKIIDELSKPFYFDSDENGYYISASIGITLYPDDALDIEGLLKNADQAMYQAKVDGRHRFNYFTESMQQDVRGKLALTQELRQALARQELHVYYQPIIELASGHIVKSEALLRWRHPDRGMISPAIFIPLAEESGLIHEIGEWVFEQSINCIERWRKQTGRIVPVSVNKSPVQFENTAEFSTWPDKLASLGLPGNSITVEITEGLLLKESPKIKQRLLEFRNSGIEVSIDDFGTGFSALSYLKQFDIDYLKIDISFIRNLTENESDKALTEAIIVMAHKLGIQTIAEGVETAEQRDMLVSFGCDYVQGFLYSPAVPADEFRKMLEK